MNILKGKKKKEILAYIQSHKIIPEDFDNNEKVITYVYFWIELVLNARHKSYAHLFVDNEYYFNDFKTEVFLAVLPQLKTVCGNFIKSKGTAYNRTLLNRKISWVVQHRLKPYISGWSYKKHGSKNMAKMYEPVIKESRGGWEYCDLEDTTFLAPDLYVEFKELIGKNATKNVSMLTKKLEKSKYKVNLVADHPPIYFDKMLELSDFFGHCSTVCGRYVTTSNYYKEVKDRKYTSSNIIKSIEKIN